MYVYDDEDNVSMNADAFYGPHNPTVYLDRAEMKAMESLPFTDPNEHEYQDEEEGENG